MAPASPAKPARLSAREYRERLRKEGLRPVQIWAPDVRSAAFRFEASRQSAAVAGGAGALDDQAFIDAASVGSRD